MIKREIKIGILLAVLLIVTVGSVSALSYTPTQVMDIQPGAANSSPQELIVFDNKLVFSADDGTNGVELWAYDGTNPPSMLANINPAGSSFPGDFAIYNNVLYFRADNGTDGSELWEYDGTNPPQMVFNLAVGPASSGPRGLTVYNGNLYFAAYMYPFGTELIRYNGAVITLAANINTNPDLANPPEDFDSFPSDLEVYNNQLYFNATEGTNGYELWSFDGATANRAADIVAGAGSSSPELLTVYNGRLYFSADTAANGTELWQYDSGTNTASLAFDIYTGAPDGFPEGLIVYNGLLYFSGTDNGTDYILWSFDGITPTPILDTDTPYWQTVFDGKLYFSGYNWPEGVELISYDGTTVAVAADINPSGHSNPRHMAAWGDRLFFQADDGSTGDELWELSDLGGPRVKTTSLSSHTLAGDFNQIRVEFTESVNDPAGNSGADDVTNPANYLLLNKGDDDVLNTVNCATGLAGDDIQIVINSVSYNSSSYIATLNINNGNTLPIGKYALFVCGTTSITDELGNRLNDGADEIIHFVIDDGLPPTGFAPGVHTAISSKNTLTSYSEMWLEVPQLGLQMDILGVPLTGNSWDVSWLGENAGWLGGSAFPTYQGNTVLTGHVWSANGYPGPFINIKSLQHGDTVKIHAWGQVFTYEVRENQLVYPTQVDTTFRHEAYDWVTLVTCEDWQPTTGSYRFRRLVRAILVDISPE